MFLLLQLCRSDNVTWFAISKVVFHDSSNKKTQKKEYKIVALPANTQLPLMCSSLKVASSFLSFHCLVFPPTRSVYYLDFASPHYAIDRKTKSTSLSLSLPPSTLPYLPLKNKQKPKKEGRCSWSSSVLAMVAWDHLESAEVQLTPFCSYFLVLLFEGSDIQNHVVALQNHREISFGFTLFPGGVAMREFPSCFGENGVQVADSSSSSTTRAAQNVVTCVYQCKLRGHACLITVSWTKNLMGQGLSVGIDDLSNQCLCKVDIKPWLFSKRKGSKNLEVDSCKIDILWDLSCAKFGSGPEPLEGFYLAVVFNHETVLLLGDLKKEAHKKIESDYAQNDAVFIAKREHIFGKKFYGAKAQFCDKGQVHDVTIECDTVGLKDPCLVIRIDSKTVIQVERLKWKFRGNHTILVDGVPVEVFWDVHNWLFGNAMGNAVFMFQSCVSAEKLWAGHSVSDPSVLKWAYSQQFRDSQLQGLGFSLILYAWKNE